MGMMTSSDIHCNEKRGPEGNASLKIVDAMFKCSVWVYTGYCAYHFDNAGEELKMLQCF